ARTRLARDGIHAPDLVHLRRAGTGEGEAVLSRMCLSVPDLEARLRRRGVPVGDAGRTRRRSRGRGAGLDATMDRHGKAVHTPTTTSLRVVAPPVESSGRTLDATSTKTTSVTRRRISTVQMGSPLLAASTPTITVPDDAAVMSA